MNIVSLHPGKSERGHHESQHNSLKTGHLATLYRLFLKPAIETGKTGQEYEHQEIHNDNCGRNRIPYNFKCTGTF